MVDVPQPAGRSGGVTRLPGEVGGRTTSTVGYFDCGHIELATWHREGLGGRWQTSNPGWRDISQAIAALTPKASPTAPIRYAFTPRGSWTLLMNDTVLGTDVGVLPSLAARELGCRALRATCIEDGSSEYPARVLELYGPKGELPLLDEHSIVAADDGGRWVFETSGRPWPFEEQDAYDAPLRRQRFTSAMLHRYLSHLGVPSDVEPRWSDTVIVERVRR